MNSITTLLSFSGAAFGLIAPGALAAEPVSRDEVRAIVSEMLADAETRSSLLAGGGDAGYDKGFFMASADGNYKLVVSGYAQIRYTANFRSTSNVSTPGDDLNIGFTNRDTKIRFSGNVVNPNLTFVVQGAFGRGDGPNNSGSAVSGDGSFALDDAFINYNVGNGWSVRAGQYKTFFLKEDNNSDVFTLAANRGVVHAAFGQSRSQGVGARYKADNWWVGADVSDGLRTVNTDYTSSKEADFAITGRFEYRLAGTDDQLKDYTSMPGDALGANIGASIHYQVANNDSDLFNADQNYLSWTVDSQIEGSGFTLFLAVVGGHTFFNSGSGVNDRHDFGLVAQGGWRFAANDEIFLKYDGILLDDDRNLSPDAYNFLTFGYNHYFAGHAAKLTVDCIMSLNRTAGLRTSAGRIVPNGQNYNSGSGVLQNTGVGLLGTSKGLEAAVRLQFQLMF